MFIIENDVLKLKREGLKSIIIGGLGHLSGAEKMCVLVRLDTCNKARVMCISEGGGYATQEEYNKDRTDANEIAKYLHKEIHEINERIIKGN